MTFLCKGKSHTVQYTEDKSRRNLTESDLAFWFTKNQRAGSQISGNRREDSELHESDYKRHNGQLHQN